jgi:hypothetical protein
MQGPPPAWDDATAAHSSPHDSPAQSSASHRTDSTFQDLQHHISQQQRTRTLQHCTFQSRHSNMTAPARNDMVVVVARAALLHYLLPLAEQRTAWQSICRPGEAIRPRPLLSFSPAFLKCSALLKSPSTDRGGLCGDLSTTTEQCPLGCEAQPSSRGFNRVNRSIWCLQASTLHSLTAPYKRRVWPYSLHQVLQRFHSNPAAEWLVHMQGFRPCVG